MNKMLTAIIGVGAATLFTAITLSALTPIYDGRPTLGSVAGLTPVAFFFTLPFSLLIGGPAILILDKFGMINILSSSLSGFIIGIIATIVIRFPGWPEFGDFIGNCLIGIISGVVFWLVWVFGERSRRAKSF
ncbi:hypothetical protein [Lysobacter antibioticus]|uniref:hypothetical protein n=1 Tax=Lysobacter antibioticus TaxID=84531 RepID=UPI0011873440|nr:hypothetical protein [Lysobacter antibioticus]